MSLAAVVSPMREVHRRLGGVKQDELMVNGQWLMLNGQWSMVNGYWYIGLVTRNLPCHSIV